MRAVKIFLFGLSLSLANWAFAQGVVKNDKEFAALKALWDSTNGAGWTTKTNWPTAGNWPDSATMATISTWYGVTVTNGDVQVINLSNNHLTGKVPSAINNLSKLRVLQLSTNSITKIPNSLIGLTSLEHIAMGSNSIQGKLPTLASSLPNLGYIQFPFNNFSGEIPSSYGNYSHLTQLVLHNNNLSGSLPSSLGTSSWLTLLLLQNNQLTGSIPSGYSGMTALQTLYLHNNKLTGSIPSTLSGLTALVWFYVHSNSLSGTVPSIFSSMPNLYGVNLSNNKFTGTLPPMRGANIEVYNNLFTGEFPTMTTGALVVNASGNRFTKLPSAIATYSGLILLNFQNNELAADAIPASLATHPNKGNLQLVFQYNRLDFGALKPLATGFKSGTTLVPQNNVRDSPTEVTTAGSALVITARPLGTSTTIVWEKQNSLGNWISLAGSDQDTVKRTFTRTTATKADEGVYRWKTNNTTFGSTTISSDAITVKTAQGFTLDNWAFQYRYDGRKRMVAKKVPGADWVYMVYDERDRLVLTQDGNQRRINQWTFTRYDALNRPVITGLYMPGSTLDTIAAKALISKTVFAEKYSKTTTTWFGYSNDVMASFPGSFEPLTVTYYDNYDFVQDDPYFGFKTGQLTGQATAFNRLKGQVTGTWTRVLGKDRQWIRTVTYYDDRYRPIQVITDNHKRGQETTTSVYDFVGKIKASKTTTTDHRIKWTGVVSATVMEDRLKSSVSSGYPLAYTIQEIPANTDGWVEFTASSYINGAESYRWFGLSEGMPSTIKYAIRQHRPVTGTSLIQIYENGTAKGAGVNVEGGDVIRIERRGDSILYSKNGVKFNRTFVSTRPALRGQMYLNLAAAELYNPKVSIPGTVHTTQRKFDYDHAGRLTRTWHSVDGEDFVLLSKQEYNELGQLVDKKLHSANGTNFKQSIDHRYNIRGWLTSLNGAELGVNDDKNTDTNNEIIDLFGMDLMYNQSSSDLSNTGMFNGNISGMKWSNDIGKTKARGYKFSYDPMNRLTAAEHKVDSAGWRSSSAFHESGVTYDRNGNIKTLSRTRSDGSVMDDLSYDYGTGRTESNILLSVTDAGATSGFSDVAIVDKDYWYDANGNMNGDRNKSINSITYNHLNLPEKVTKSSGDYIAYVYDATGKKLFQDVYNPSNVLKKRSDYVGELFYENDTLKFVNHEEGRIIMTGTEPEYQYYLKDHLGNVRMTLTAKDEIESATATVENENVVSEAGEFLNYDKMRRVNHPVWDHTYDDATPPNGSTYAIRLNGSANEKIGLAKSLAVKRGDRIKIEVYAKYYQHEPGPNLGAFATLMASIVNGTPPSGTFLDGGGYSTNSTTIVPGEVLTSKSSQTSEAPKAYLNWLVFDRDFNFIPDKSNFKRISTAAREDTTNIDHERLAPDSDLVMTEPGYVYIYLSNENATPVEVYFDDFKVEHIKNPVIQSEDYYPFGLTYNSYQRGNSSKNFYQYNGKELQDELGTGWLDYGARMYMNDIGRWGVVDPLSDKSQMWSPYTYAKSNPIIYIDPDGQFDVTIHGEQKEEALTQLQSSVKDELTLSMDDSGKVSYTMNGAGTTPSKNAQQLMTAIDDHSVNVNVITTSENTVEENKPFLGGAFLGTSVTQNKTPDGLPITEGFQLVNTSTMSKMESYFDAAPGQGILHEVTESYHASKLSQETGVSYGRADLTLSNHAAYTKAHFAATPPINGSPANFSIRYYDGRGNQVGFTSHYSDRIESAKVIMSSETKKPTTLFSFPFRAR